MSTNKPLSFYTGEFGIKVDNSRKLKQFLELFSSDDDKYYAFDLFLNKRVLEIVPECCDPMDCEKCVYNPNTKLYNLRVLDSPDFYVESLEEFCKLKRICDFFGFKFTVNDGSVNSHS